MPWEVVMRGEKHCVVKKGTGETVNCHDTHDKAVAQMRALYAAEGGKMSKRATYLVDINSIALSETTGTWVHALPIGKYKHSQYGDINIDSGRAQRFADSVKKKVRGIDPSINYNHNNDGPASGWVKDADARSDGVWLLVEFTDDAKKEIKDRKYRYFSTEFDDVWEDSQGNTFEDVIYGGGLTNRPFMKNLVPINLSEAYLDNAFDLVATLTEQDVDSLKGGKMPLSEEDLAKIVEGVSKKLTETPPPPPKKEDKPTLGLEEIEDLKKLAEENHLVKGLIEHFEKQGGVLQETAKQLRETTIKARMAEFDRGSKLVLTPVSRKLTEELLLTMPTELSDKFMELLNEFRRSQVFMVELGERSGARVSYGNEKSAKVRFNELTQALVSGGTPYADAVSQVSRDHPGLYEEYRREMTATVS